MKPLAPVTLSRPTGHWVAPVLFSVAVHASLAAGYVFFDADYTPPRPPTVFPVEVVLASEMPGLGDTPPSEPVESVAQAPSAPAERQEAIEKPPITEPTDRRPVKAPAEPDQKAETMVDATVPAPLAPQKPETEPETDPEPEPAAIPAAAGEPGRIHHAVFAPHPKRKPVLSPPPISKASKLPDRSKFSEPDETTGPAVPQPSDTQQAALPRVDAARDSSDSLPAIASAGEATAKLVPPSYATPGRGNPLPTYPRSAKRRGLEGRLILRVQIRADGLAESVEIVESSGHPLLDRAAERAVRKWAFQPARRAGIPVSAMLDVPVVFRLRN